MDPWQPNLWRSRALRLTSEEDGVLTGLLVLSSGVEDGQILAEWDVDGGLADLFEHLVDEYHVGKVPRAMISSLPLRS